MKVIVTFEGCIIGDGTDDDFIEHFDAVMDELVTLGAEDPDIGTRLGSGEVEISVTVDADSLDDANERGSAMIRAAIHAGGGSTPGWRVEWVSARTQHDLAPA
jgi:hypothetical protein